MHGLGRHLVLFGLTQTKLDQFIYLHSRLSHLYLGHVNTGVVLHHRLLFQLIYCSSTHKKAPAVDSSYLTHNLSLTFWQTGRLGWKYCDGRNQIFKKHNMW